MSTLAEVGPWPLKPRLSPGSGTESLLNSSGRPLLHWLQSMPFAYCRQRVSGLLRGATVILRSIPIYRDLSFAGRMPLMPLIVGAPHLGRREVRPHLERMCESICPGADWTTVTTLQGQPLGGDDGSHRNYARNRHARHGPRVATEQKVGFRRPPLPPSACVAVATRPGRCAMVAPVARHVALDL